MWILLVVVLIIAIIVVWLLWARVVLCINSYRGQYYLSYGGFLKVEPVERGDQILVRIKLPFYSFTRDPMSSGKEAKKPGKQPKAKKKAGSKLKRSFYLKTVIEVLRTFSFRQFIVDIDTGDYVLNARLIPVLIAMNQFGVQWEINYCGYNNLWIEVENRPVRVLPIVFRFVKEKYL